MEAQIFMIFLTPQVHGKCCSSYSHTWDEQSSSNRPAVWPSQSAAASVSQLWPQWPQLWHPLTPSLFCICVGTLGLQKLMKASLVEPKHNIKDKSQGQTICPRPPPSLKISKLNRRSDRTTEFPNDLISFGRKTRQSVGWRSNRKVLIKATVTLTERVKFLSHSNSC